MSRCSPKKYRYLILATESYRRTQTRTDTVDIMIALLCLAVDQEQNILGNEFIVRVPANHCVNDLQMEIKKKKSPELDYLAADRLVLWKPSSPIPLGAERKDFFQRIEAIKFPDPKDDEALEGSGPSQILENLRKISRYWEGSPKEKDHLDLIVQVPRRVATDGKRKHPGTSSVLRS
jgi:hypothetical protein